MKFETLNNILDKIAVDAPSNFKSFKDTSTEDKRDQVRSKSLIHLFLMVRFGIQDFTERNNYITDGSNDGGIDAYYIDKESKQIYIIQSKYRTNKFNFESKEINIDEIIKMEIGNILKGSQVDSNGTQYNGKILGMQRIINDLPQLGLYTYKVIFLCNLKKYHNNQISRLVENFDFEVFDYEKIYNKLVFPLLISKYYDPDLLDIKIKLDKKSIPNLQQMITTANGEFAITVVFVPTYEIGKAMLKYKNALLVYNPRNYLSLSTNDVNKSIRDSIIKCDTGEFAILNNGITIFADGCGVNNISGRNDEGTVTISKPQIINGGQTAYTLSLLVEEGHDKSIFENKEVMLKIITPSTPLNPDEDNNDLKVINQISKATNQQSKINDSDMLSNDERQVELQRLLYEKFGGLYERKKGEFEEAILKKYITKENVIKREELLKSYWSFKGNPGRAKNIKSEQLFDKSVFYDIIDDLNDVDKIYLSWQLYHLLSKLERKHKRNDYNQDKFGFALRYGKNAMIYMYALIFNLDHNFETIEQNLYQLLNNWKIFDQFATNKNSSKKDNFNIVNYYRSTLISNDIFEFHSQMAQLINQDTI